MAVKLDPVKIKNARKAKELYQKDLAKIIGIESISVISNAECMRTVSLFTAKKICEALGIDVAEAIMWSDEPITAEAIAKCDEETRLRKSEQAKIDAGRKFTENLCSSDDFSVGDSVMVYVSFGLTLKEKRQGKIIAKHKRFALVDLGHYRESFNYVDIEKAEGRKAV